MTHDSQDAFDRIRKAVEARDRFLQDHPQLQPLQDEITRLMRDMGSQHNRLVLLDTLLREKALELQRRLIELREAWMAVLPEGVDSPPDEEQPAQVAPLHEETRPAQVAPRHEEGRPTQVAPRHEEAQPAQVAPRHEEAQPAEVAPRHAETQPGDVAPPLGETGPEELATRPPGKTAAEPAAASDPAEPLDTAEPPDPKGDAQSDAPAKILGPGSAWPVPDGLTGRDRPDRPARPQPHTKRADDDPGDPPAGGNGPEA